MTPDEAVEAAARAMYDSTAHDGCWDEMATDDEKATSRSYARAALEAAAPFIRAQVLRDAVAAFPLETITAPDNAVVWLMRRAGQIEATL